MDMKTTIVGSLIGIVAGYGFARVTKGKRFMGIQMASADYNRGQSDAIKDMNMIINRNLYGRKLRDYYDNSYIGEPKEHKEGYLDYVSEELIKRANSEISKMPNVVVIN